MVQLGSWPQQRDYVAWITQRMANRAPEYAYLRRWPFSIGQQLLNPVGREIQETVQQLTEERNNIFLTSANINLLDNLYRLELGVGMEFQHTKDVDGQFTYVVPRVYAMIDEVEYELTVAENNSIQSLAYDALPSRIEDGEESHQYTEVIPRTTISDLPSTSVGALPIEGKLHVTLRGNTTWEYRGRERIYYPKVFIRGRTRKDTNTVESIPVRYNGTFITNNQWQSIEEIFVSYLDEDAEITVEVLPFDQESLLDTRNISVPVEAVESWRFVRLGDASGDSTLVSERFTQNMDIVELGYNDKDIEYEIELVDESNNNVSLLGAAWKPNTNYMFAVDADNLYVFDTRLPYPDCTKMKDYSHDTKMDLYSSRWVYMIGETAVLQTDNLDVLDVPWKIRWSLEEPNGDLWYLGVDGSKWPTTTDAWIDNYRWEEALWNEQRIELLLDQSGVYIVTIECLYTDPDVVGREFTKTTKLMLYTPRIAPEVTIPLPDELKNATGLMFDDDGSLWVQVAGDIMKANVFYDYFIVDYLNKTVLLRENYTSARVVI